MHLIEALPLQVEAALNNARDRTKATLDRELDRIQRKIDADSSARQAKLNELKDYLNRLEVAQRCRRREHECRLEHTAPRHGHADRS